MLTEEIISKRKLSLERLRASKLRSSEKIPFIEKIINKTPPISNLLYKCLLKLAGIQIGENVYFNGKIRVKLRGNPKNIKIGDNVYFGKNVDLRIRENGKIELLNRVYLDDDVRIVAAREGKVKIDIGTEVGSGSVFTSGGRLSIGKFCLIASNVNINSSSHGTSILNFIKENAHEHGEINIGDDVWLGSYSVVVMNSSIGEGSVIGANSVVKGNIPSFSICVGSPAKVIKYRN